MQPEGTVASYLLKLLRNCTYFGKLLFLKLKQCNLNFLYYATALRFKIDQQDLPRALHHILDNFKYTDGSLSVPC